MMALRSSHGEYLPVFLGLVLLTISAASICRGARTASGYRACHFGVGDTSGWQQSLCIALASLNTDVVQ